MPTGDLVFDSAGNLYGATMFGGGFSSCDPFYLYCGTIFELSPPQSKGGAWTEKVLYSFQNGTDGAVPNGGLILDKKGALYGTTFCGGEQPCDNLSQTFGVAFRLKPPRKPGGQWRYRVLYRFGSATLNLEAQNPGAGLILDKNCNLYGTTIRGGQGSDPAGTVFELSNPGNMFPLWRQKVVHTFNFDESGVNPMTGLVFDGNGDLYGTARGGRHFSGLIFRLKPQANHNWSYVDLYDFNGPPDGYQPASPLRFDSAGNLYGTTDAGGNGPCQGGGCGAVFEFGPTD